MAGVDDYGGGGGAESDPYYNPSAPQNDPQDPYAQAKYDSVASFYRNALGREGSRDEILGWLSNGMDMAAIQTAIYGSPEAQARTTAAPTTTTVDPGTGGGGGGGGGGGTNLTTPFQGGTLGSYAAQAGGLGSYAVPSTPTFNAPGYAKPPAFSYADFEAPTGEQVKSEPGYAFGEQEGRTSLENSAAARGVLGTGGTLADIIAWGGNYATNRYGDAWNRKYNQYSINRNNAADTYRTNYQTQYVDPYQFSYKAALDANANALHGFDTQVQAGQHQSDMDWSRAYDLMNFDWNKFRDWRDSTWNMNKDVAFG